MTLYRYWSRFAGYLVILVRGSGLEKLLNLASTNGIGLWNIRRYRPDSMVACIGISGFRALRPLLRRTRCVARIKRRQGWPFLWQRLIGRPGFFLGSFLFVAALAFLSCFVWRVELDGVKRIPAARIRKDLRKLGLYEGVLRGRLDKDRIQRELELMTREASWIGVEIRGMVAVVHVVERVEAPAQRPSGDLIAARDGLVTRVVVYRGTQVVSEGETVHAGQLLVSGSEVRIGTGGTLESRKVPASASVMARIWDEATAITPLTVWRTAPTGRRRTVIRLRLGRWPLTLGPRRPPYALFQHLRTGHGLGQGRNTLPLVEVVLDRYYEVKPVVQRRTLPAATAAGTAEARALLQARFPADRKGPSVQINVQTEPGWVQVVASAESLQDIALPRAFAR